MQAGILTDILDGPGNLIKKSIDKLIIGSLNQVQSVLDSIEEKFNNFVTDSESKARQIRANVHGDLKDILNEVG